MQSKQHWNIMKYTTVLLWLQTFIYTDNLGVTD